MCLHFDATRLKILGKSQPVVTNKSYTEVITNDTEKNKITRVKGLQSSFDEAGDTADNTATRETLESLMDGVIK